MNPLLLNPYSGKDFFGFFSVLLQRVLSLCSGRSGSLVSDEIQLLVLIFLSVSLAFLGSFLVVKQRTMIANALSHTLLLGIVSAFLLFHHLFGFPAYSASLSSLKVLWTGALIASLVTTLLIQFLEHRFRVREDAGIALVFTTLFALGVFLVTLFTRNMHLGVEAVMGNIDALGPEDVVTTGLFALGSVFLYLLFFRGFLVSAFDSPFAKTVGIPVRFLDYLLMVLTAGGAVASFRAVGVLLFLALLSGPVLVARLYTKEMKKIIFYAFVVGSSCSLFAVAAARHFLTVFQIPLSTSGIAVTGLFLLYGALLIRTGRARSRAGGMD